MREEERVIYLGERRVSLCFAFHHLCAKTIPGPLFCQRPRSNRNPVLISPPGGRKMGPPPVPSIPSVWLGQGVRGRGFRAQHCLNSPNRCG